MGKFIFNFLIIGLLCGISGCATNWIQMPLSMQQQMESEVQVEPEPAPEPQLSYRRDSHNDMPVQAETSVQPQAFWRTPPHQYKPRYTHKALADYAEQIAMTLVDSVKDARLFGTVGVSSFVYFDRTLQQTDLLGNHLSEALITEMQQFGLAVIDFKLTDDIAVSPSGDYIFSRRARDLANQLAIDYVLAGTMKRTAKGVTVNARLVHSADKFVIASAKVDIPHFLIDDLMPDYVVSAY